MIIERVDNLKKNKIYLGDAYELIKQLNDKSVDLVYADPPYLFGGFNKGNSFGVRNPLIADKTKRAIEKISGGG